MRETHSSKRPFARVVGALTLALALTAGASAFGQTTTTGDGGAGAFAGGQPPAVPGDPATAVPGLGATDGWEGYGDNPDGMISAGVANAPGNEYLEVLGGGAVNAARYDLSNNDDWLKRSFDILNDAEGNVGGLTDNATTSCAAESGQKTKTETSLYTCESGKASYDAQETCQRAYQPIFDTDYLYKCVAGDEWRAVPKTCEPERIVVVDEDYVYLCRTGTMWTHTPASCERKRIVVVDEDYVYGCVQTWNGSSHAGNAACNANGAAGCAPSGGRTCTAASGLPANYTCQTGYKGTESSQTCGSTLQVETTGGWIYEWNGFSQAPPSTGDFPRSNEYCNLTSYDFDGSYWNYGYLCNQEVRDLSVPDGGVSYGGFDGYESGSYWVTGSCAAANNSSCREVSTRCTSGPGTRNINGVSVYKDCWAQETVYTCGSREDYAGCAPPPGMAQTGSTCIAYNDGGVCTGTQNTYVDPSGGCSRYEQSFRCEDPVPGAGSPSEILRDIISDTWDNGCNALAGNGACVKQGEVVIEGNATKVINGLPVTRNPWHVREDYICSSSSNVNSCTPFSGCTQQTQTCVSQDRAGTCSAWDRTYRCENPVNDGGTPIETPRDIVGEYWTDPCATNRNDPYCRLTANEVLIGNETRIINGLSVTRDPWKRRETWTCDRSSPIDTCGPVKTCMVVREDCGRLDPHGQCSALEKTYRCEDPMPGAGTPSGEVTDHVGGDIEAPDSCRQSSQVGCRKQGTECTGGGGTKMINGVPTTTGCWEETDTYICEYARPDTNNCTPPSGCELMRQECLDGAVGSDQCRTFENVYQCKKEVLVEETLSTCQTKVCIGDMCIGQDDEGSSDLPDALAAMLIAQMAGEDYSKNLTIFKGEPMRCRKAVLGFRNCCKDSGWGVDIGLTQCSAEEETLMIRQEAKATHYVGTYCSQKSFLGVCLEKAMRYCSFDGTLARIVQEHGRPQINKGWGTPQNANCDGFSVEEFERLDLSDADFSDFTDDAMNKITNPDQNSTLGRISENISNLMGSNTPGYGDVDEAGKP